MEKKMTELTNEELLAKFAGEVLCYYKYENYSGPLEQDRREVLRLMNLGAAVSASPQPSVEELLKEFTANYARLNGMREQLATPKYDRYIEGASDFAEEVERKFFAPAPAQEFSAEFVAQQEELREMNPELYEQGSQNVVRLHEKLAAQLVENSNRCRHCGGEIIRCWIGHVHEACNGFLHRDNYHRCQSGDGSTIAEPIPGGASTPSTPWPGSNPNKANPEYISDAEKSKFLAARPSEPSAPKVEPPNSLLSGITSQSTDEPLIEPDEICPMIFAPRPTQATETASAPCITNSGTYGELPAKIRDLGLIQPHEWDNMTGHQQRDWLIENWAAPSVAGTQPTPDVTWPCDNCGRPFNQHYTMARFCVGDRPGKVFCAAQGTPQVEEIAKEILVQVLGGNDMVIAEELKSVAKILRKHLPGAPAQPGPEEKR